MLPGANRRQIRRGRSAAACCSAPAYPAALATACNEPDRKSGHHRAASAAGYRGMFTSIDCQRGVTGGGGAPPLRAQISRPFPLRQAQGRSPVGGLFADRTNCRAVSGNLLQQCSRIPDRVRIVHSGPRTCASVAPSKSVKKHSVHLLSNRFYAFLRKSKTCETMQCVFFATKRQSVYFLQKKLA